MYRKQKKKKKKKNIKFGQILSRCTGLKGQTIFVKRLCPPKTVLGKFQYPQTSQQNLGRFACIRLASLTSTDPRIIFPYYPVYMHIKKPKKNYSKYFEINKSISQSENMRNSKKLAKSTKFLKVNCQHIPLASYSNGITSQNKILQMKSWI